MSLKVVMAVFPLNDIFFETPCRYNVKFESQIESSEKERWCVEKWRVSRKSVNCRTLENWWWSETELNWLCPYWVCSARQLALTHFRSYFGKLYEYPPQYLRHTARPHLQPFKGKQRLYTAQEINGSLMGRSSVKHREWIRGVKLRGTSVKFPFPNVCGDMFSISVDEANSDSDSDLLNHCTIVSRLD